jgi:hypothetical protein
MGAFTVLRVEQGENRRGIDHDQAVARTFDIVNTSGDITLIGSIVADPVKPVFVPEILVQPRFGANPEVAGFILGYSKDPVIGNGGRITRFIGIYFEIITIEAVQSVLGPDPDKSARILENAVHHRL